MTEMQRTLLNECNLPLEQCSVFLQEQYPYKLEVFLLNIHDAL